jgi:glycosyltransferase involved in cell wall biosynthesis
MASDRLTIAQVTPSAWEADDEVNEMVRRLSAELAARGHRVLVLAPTESRSLVRDSRRDLRAAAKDPDALFDGADGQPVVLGVGEVLRVPGGRRRQRSLPLDVARTIEEALDVVPLDLVHVHEPFAPSASSAALRVSRGLNVGSFHAPTEHVLSTQLGRKVVELVFGRLDARTAASEATRSLMQAFFPSDYRVVPPGADPPPHVTRAAGGPPRLAFVADEERAALRLAVRALRRLPLDADWTAILWSRRGFAAVPALRREIRERVTFAGPEDASEEEVLAGADILVAASLGTAPAPSLLRRGLAAGAVPVASRLPIYEEVLDDGAAGLLFEPGDVDTLAAQLTRLLAEPGRRDALREAAAPLRATLGWDRAADQFESIYAELAARRHPADGNPAIRQRLAGRPLIDVDLHMHTDHSGDCATPVEVLLSTAKAQGLGAIAVTDHNEISGALEAQAKADGIKVIVGEEVKTGSQGEVIGLFLTEKIERGLTLAETIAEIKRQGGIVYVPHPFDRLHSVPDYEHLLDVLDEIDAIEVFNPRIAFKPFNDEAVRFAAKYRIVGGAGSDSHVAAGLGSVRIRMRDFDGPEEFLESLREADILQRPTSLLYVQALKFIETKATPPAARRARRERRVRRAARQEQSDAGA